MPGGARYGEKVEKDMSQARPGENPYGSALGDLERFKKFEVKPCNIAPVEKSIPCLPVPQTETGEVSIVVELRDGDAMFNRWFIQKDHDKVNDHWKEFEKYLRTTA